jgi:transcriptional regulator with XRE-family HTH domain
MERRKRPSLKVMAKAFATRLKKLRTDKGLTQRDLAKLVGCETVLISRYERGEGLPKFDTLVMLAEVLRISTDELALGRSPSEPPKEPPIQNVLLLERFRELETLPREDQTMVIQLVDAVLAKRRMEAALSPVRRSA